MRRCGFRWTALALTAAVFLGLAAGCKKETRKPAGPATAPAGPAAPVAAAVFANTKCPIMGNPIDPAKVTPDLTRELHGEKVAFCCADCPPKWDKLTDEEKHAKLAAAK